MTFPSAVGESHAFLQRLVAKDILTAAGAARASEALTATAQPLDMVLTELGLLREDQLAAQFSEVLQLSCLAELPDLDPALVGQVGAAFCEFNAVVPLIANEEKLSLAVCDPFSRLPIDALAFHFDCPPDLTIVTRSQIMARLKALEKVEDDTEQIGMDEQTSAGDIERLRDVAREAPVVRFVTRVISDAIDRGATDIHIEPEEDHVRVRVRIDGMLMLRENAPRALHAGIVTRIKILSQLNIAERRIPQDGRMRAVVRGQTVDMRVSVVPSAHGETIVLRILDRSRVTLELGALGFAPDARNKITELSRLANGIVLITGPTGSGKTTTLYSLLKDRSSPDVKIFTVEDPIEYRLKDITQLQVDQAIDLDFATALRSVLRQDPDIILVGEIRDRETAEVAIRAALTGHLVFSTLHTNSAAGAFTRLADIGVDRYLLGATIRGVIGQRLLRRACQTCTRGAENGPTACKACNGTGYSGRMVAYEILPVTPRIAALAGDGVDEATMEAAARQEGMVNLADHARALVASGETTKAEVARVIDLGDASL